MSFVRTNSGLSNLHLFFGVDSVVFLEGGKSFSIDEIKSGQHTNASQDIRFWQSVFEIYRPKQTFQFRSVGSKQCVNQIAKEVKEGAVTNIIVAMDRDFDNLNNAIIEANNVIYTYGYSWENDVWAEDSVIDAIRALTGSCKTSMNEEIEIISNFYKECFAHLRWCILIDAILLQSGASFFNRDEYMKYVNFKRSGIPSVNKEEIASTFAQVKKEIERPITRKSHIPPLSLKDCFGHLFAEYAYRIMVYILKKLKRMPNLPKEYATGIVVEKFKDLLANGNLASIKAHYDVEFSRVTP